MSDPTESVRREMVAEINSTPGSRAALEAKHGTVWDTTELQRDFEALGFLAPFVVARRRADGVKGSLIFQHAPRLYYGFKPEYVDQRAGPTWCCRVGPAFRKQRLRHRQ